MRKQAPRVPVVLPMFRCERFIAAGESLADPRILAALFAGARWREGP